MSRSKAALLAGERDVARSVAGPDRTRSGRRSVPSGVEDAEQVVDAVVERERVALEVEEEVARVRLGQHGQPALGSIGVQGGGRRSS